MRIIELDASNWTSGLDVYRAILGAVGAPEWHSMSPDALVDSMIWGGINALDPPYMIRISGVTSAPKEVSDEVGLTKWVLAEGRKDYQERRDGDVEVSIETAP